MSPAVVSTLFPSEKKLSDFCQSVDISYLGLFGSQARGEARRSSDVDLLVDFEATKSLFELSDIVHELEQMVQKKVDLANRKSLKPHLKSNVLKDLILLYEKK